MIKTGMTARWTASTGASLALVLAVALVAAPVVGAGPGDGGGDGPIAGLIGGDGPGFGGGGEGGGQGHGVHGRAMSKGEADSYGLGLRAHGDGENSRGRLFFGHRGASGDDGFAGEITCLSVSEDGVVQVSGSTREGRGHQHGRRGGGGKEGEPKAVNGGGEGGHDGSPEGSKGGQDGSKDGPKGDQASAGKDFAFTILTKSDPQQFSLPKLGDPGTLTPCGGGDATTVAVTKGGFQTRN